MALIVPWAAMAQTPRTLTVCNGTTTSSNAPIRGGYGTQSEFIYPARLLEAMDGGTISSVKFYATKETDSYSSSPVTVYVQEVNDTIESTSAWQYNQSSATKVYEGSTLTVTDSVLIITFSSPYEYNGGHLCFNVWKSESGSYLTVNYYGINPGYYSCGYDYSITPPVSNPYSRAQFLPKVEFTYTASTSNCEKPATFVHSNVTSSSATLTWSGGSGIYNVDYKKASDTEWTSVLTSSALTTTTLSLDENTAYEARVQSVCTSGNSGYKNVNFKTPCDDQDIPYTYGFETADSLDCWTIISHVERSTSYPHGGSSYSLKFVGTAPNMVALPQFTEATNTLRLEFWTRPESRTSNSGKFDVGYMTDLSDATTFHALATYINTDWTEAFWGNNSENNYVKKIVDFNNPTDNVPANAFIVMRQYDNSSSWYWFVDDVTVKPVPSCLEPEALAEVENSATANSVQLQWTAVSGVQHWKLQYKKVGTTEWTTVDVANTDLDGNGVYTLPGLESSSSYNVRIAAWCGYPGTNPEDMSEYCAPIEVNTACEVYSTFPFNEKFDSYTAGNNVLPTCWKYINTTTYSSYQVYPKIYNSYSNSPSNCLAFVSYDYYYSSTSYDPQPQYAILREMTGLAGKQITLMARGYNSSSTFKVGLMTDPTDANTFVEIPTTQTLTTSYQEFTYDIPANATAHYVAIMIDAAASSGYGTYNGVYVDDICIDVPPTCIKPSALMLETPSAKTAHSASLKWTNGSDDQTAWQIAYSTASNFNPDTVTIVNVNTNPDTLTGLTQYTTYYAYVRANCGDGDFSKWSTSKYSFTTLNGHQTPTNLAYDPATLTSSSVRVNWKGVAANELHMYYELYYDTLSTRPNPLVAENLKIVQGEIDTTYLLEGLQAEKKYYVWVRDTCGTDGYSNWTSSINFTTASACQTPDGLAANDVTTNSASITWNTYGQTGFNLRYREEGGSWNDRTDVTPGCELTGLTENTPYEVLVQVQCNLEKWSDTLRFRSECDVKTITEDHFFTEDFEAPVVNSVYNSTTGLEMPYCWDNGYIGTGTSAYYYPHLIKADAGTNGYNYSSPASQVLFFYGSGNNFAVLPEFTNALNTLQIDFKYATESSSNGTLTLGYITDEDENFNTFDTIEVFKANNDSYHKFVQVPTVYLDNVPANATRIVFRWYYSSWYGLNIDDVVVKLAPSCKPVKTFATSNVKAHSVDLAWTVYDETQTSFDVQYGFSQNFHEDSTFINNGVSLTEGKYVLSGLTHDTTYYVRVRANCGGGEVSPWSDSKRVVTPAGNQAPSSFAVVYGSEGPHYVSLVWNQGGELATSWDLYYVKSETAPEEAPTVATPATVTVNTLPTAEAPYLLEGLDAESRYYIWVRANCGIDGLSAWKALSGAYFTTLEACPMPVNGEVTNLTPVSAQLNWTGYAENYNVRYRTAAYSYPTEGSFFEGFESGTLNGWTAIRGNEGVSQTDWHVINSETLFDDPIPAHSGTNVAMSRSWYSDYYDAPNVDNWLISPQVTLNGQLSYWARGNALYPEHYEVYVSTTTSDTTAFTLLYTPSIVTDNWVEHTVDLSTYAGQQGYIAFRHTDNDKDYLFIDDVLVGSMVTVEAGAWSASIPAIGDSLVIERLSPETAYEWKVQAVCGGEDGSSLWSDSTMFTTPSACDAPVNLAATNETYNSATLSWSNYQETYNLRYRTAADADIYLEDSFEDGELGDWTTILTSSYGGGGVGEGYFYFGYTYNPPQYLISPLLDENGVVEGSTLYFLYQGYSDDLPETFQVGYSSTTNDVSAFTWGTTITIGADVGAYSQTIPAGTKYFAIKHTAYNAWYLYVTNFLVFGPVTPAGEWVDVEGPVENPYTLAGLNPDTPYEFQVQGNNTSCEGDTTAWSQSGWFETLPLPTQTIALVEGANWVSFNVETNLNDLKAALVEAFPNTAISIKSKNQTHSYNPSNNRWSGRFDALNLANMYIIRVVQNGEIVLQGLPVDPSEHPITINAGVSVYLAYPFSENMTLTDAFAGFASNGDKIKSKTKNCNYTRNRWGNQITSLEPGKGYIYVGAADAGDGRVFVYPDNSNRGAQETVQTPKMHIFPDASKATLKAMPIPTIDKKASKSSTKALDKKGMPNEQKD